eukprot:jgi/Bigna1/80825/fgenesh1_pg.74_\
MHDAWHESTTYSFMRAFSIVLDDHVISNFLEDVNTMRDVRKSRIVCVQLITIIELLLLLHSSLQVIIAALNPCQVMNALREAYYDRESERQIIGKWVPIVEAATAKLKKQMIATILLEERTDTWCERFDSNRDVRSRESLLIIFPICIIWYCWVPCQKCKEQILKRLGHRIQLSHSEFRPVKERGQPSSNIHTLMRSFSFSRGGHSIARKIAIASSKPAKYKGGGGGSNNSRSYVRESRESKQSRDSKNNNANNSTSEQKHQRDSSLLTSPKKITMKRSRDSSPVGPCSVPLVVSHSMRSPCSRMNINPMTKNISRRRSEGGKGREFIIELANLAPPSPRIKSKFPQHQSSGGGIPRCLVVETPSPSVVTPRSINIQQKEVPPQSSNSPPIVVTALGGGRRDPHTNPVVLPKCESSRQQVESFESNSPRAKINCQPLENKDVPPS